MGFDLAAMELRAPDPFVDEMDDEPARHELADQLVGPAGVGVAKWVMGERGRSALLVVALDADASAPGFGLPGHFSGRFSGHLDLLPPSPLRSLRISRLAGNSRKIFGEKRVTGKILITLAIHIVMLLAYSYI
jgi:hypothetical protein